MVVGKLNDLTEEKLQELYWEKEFSSREIAKRYNCSNSSIISRMKKWNIKSRSKSEANSLHNKKLKKLNKEKLQYLYHEKEMSQIKIAEKYNCCSSTIYSKMKKWNIPTRSFSQAKKVAWKKGKYEDANHKGNPGYEHTEEMKRYLSKANSGENSYWYGKKKSEQHRQKIRETKVEKLKQNKIKPQYNEEACKLFDNLNERFNWNIQHAENGKEKYIDCGYWVDGYESELNLVLEYDERHHFREGKLKEKDIEREEKIKSELNCKFVRIKKNKEAYKGPNELVKKVNSVINDEN